MKAWACICVEALFAERYVGGPSLSDSESLRCPRKTPKSFRVEGETHWLAINPRQGADCARFLCGPI